jgi:hypothetical protein
MRFRCVAAIALWTMIAGPVFGPPVGLTPSRPRPAAVAPAPDLNQSPADQDADADADADAP